MDENPLVLVEQYLKGLGKIMEVYRWYAHQMSGLMKIIWNT